MDLGTRKIGELIIRFPHAEKPDGEAFCGTAILYQQISTNCFVIKTTAHNLLKIEKDPRTGER